MHNYRGCALGHFSIKDLYWAAGFIEGEGCFSLGRWIASSGSKRIQSRVSACQNNPEPVDKLLWLFGGHIGSRLQEGRTREHFTWHVQEARARGVMMTLYPLMSYERQEQIRYSLKETNQWLA